MGSTRGVSPMESMEQSKEEKVMPAEEGKPDTEEEPLHKLKSIAWGAGASMLAYGVVETLAEGDAEIAEDAVDFLHSTYTSCVAVSGISSLQPHSEHRVALPEDMAKGRGPVVRMFCHSLGYFLADVGLILVRGGVFRNWPKLWAARLTHHFIQTCAVSPCLFRTRPAEALALRSVLCIAYFAEFSNIFLRLSNFLRRRNGSISLRRAVNLMLLGSFAASRMFNFAFAMRVFWLARAYVHPRIFQMLISIQASGYMLNLAWFVKIAQIAAKSVSIPSVEC
mmetsp:Transcript_117947/g.279977  ORF Transcript_117947/g.279977 Transcript_117947/m.279977 type:complete len:280 (+) Transcript_117947:84-923(+)